MNEEGNNSKPKKVTRENDTCFIYSFLPFFSIGYYECPIIACVSRAITKKILIV